ncbi:putative secreted protein [Prochlorococcus marinus str. MIT 9123]|uniref:Putative secreted protein n=1 Tax=Prochlorococcus marinus str. MIT 9116 TaxID=167544 RepID=A0A0A1ZQM7_PROMR|nr:YadA-like family protein [Prochlorococcus marinus]KGF90836.1 putative secreted protein [Prochlorococcus marinus str. MIT 9116]KGF93602.1 putative secreted protein [Prochlorococcus marinus str. MIT 9123]
MKKLLPCLLLSSISLPFLSAPAKADTPTNSYVDIIDDYIVPNQLNSAADYCSSFIGIAENDDDVNCTKFGLGPAIQQNHKNIISNYNNIDSLGEGIAGSTALTAALSALPQMSKESKTTCGLGSGVYSSRYAVGFGCASMVS